MNICDLSSKACYPHQVDTQYIFLNAGLHRVDINTLLVMTEKSVIEKAESIQLLNWR